MTILESVQNNFSAINNASGEFLTKLTGTDIKRDILLSAEMAGLMLLRASSTDVSKIPAGTVILGAVPEQAVQMLNSFVLTFARLNGLNPKDLDFATITSDSNRYLPELTQFEQPFYDVCGLSGVDKDLFPYVAAAASGKLVLAGNKLGLMPPKVGLSLLLFHIVAGSKTAPYPLPNQNQKI